MAKADKEIEEAKELLEALKARAAGVSKLRKEAKSISKDLKEAADLFEEVELKEEP